MDPQNKKNSPILLLLILFVILFFFSLFTGNLNLFGIKVKVFDPFSDIKPDSLLKSEVNLRPFLLSGSKFAVMMPLIFRSEPSAADLSGSLQNLEYFYKSLKSAKRGKVRIAHFGDSVIEGDLITSDFRAAVQQKFGGEGIGMLSFTSDDTRFRVTVKHTFSDDWKSYSFFGGTSSGLHLGINGTASVPSKGSWIKLESSGVPGTLKSIDKVVIYYSDAKSSQLKYSMNGGADKTVNLETGSDLKQLILDAGGAKSIRITATANEQAKFYGLSLESANGIIVDNFPLRGNSGISIRDIPVETMKEFNNFLDYKLIILQFGLNLITSGKADYDWYNREMTKVIKQLKAAFPETSILLVSVGDKSVKKGTRLATDPAVVQMVKTQKQIAESTGILFWNLFESMGGENSMLEWVNSKPPLAMKDYTHFNNEGARKIGRMLCDAVLTNYK
jgi:lysophospholipase L1-like esterase